MITYPKRYQESELLAEVSANNEAAFVRLFHQYHQLLGTFIFKITKSKELTEEVVQDVFLKIWLNRETLTEVKDFKAYLFVVSKNHALNCLKKLSKECRLTVTLDEEIGYDLSEGKLDDEMYVFLDEAIDRLPAQQKRVYLLSRHERLKYNEIALKLNISKETVKKYLQLSSESISVYLRSKISTLVSVVFLFIS
ncbi:RNA polymerase sigma-70 factor (ECF subfamily) [Dyadobacter jejuensis]|uniref:RNA polymerase sigma factor n=1 Tax=Dyadobacter jejuensis TaxID=1082580 RepID=A0A316AMV4_9BACT|nr:sigma-70 family RNA polymerase sigma factor [Dyadobacter jejuensis]PWJ58639.1 RNA polymerase sigma-70 factor (ECF subfamily) [Dyadobacter jejuensis]